MLTNRNQLPAMQALERPDFEVLFNQFKTDFLDNLAQTNAEQAAAVAQTLAIEGELITKLLQAFTQYLIGNIEAENHKARQMLPGTAIGTNLDSVASLQGLTRQVITHGNTNALPPIPAVQETDDHLLQRFWLAPHAPAAGTRLHYAFQMLTLDAGAVIAVDKPNDHQVRLTYTYGDASVVSELRDGNGRRTALGEITLTVLANSGDGTASAQLQNKVAAHFARDDVGIETDSKIVQSAQPVLYTQELDVWITSAPDTALVKAELEQKLTDYAQTQWKLGGKVLRSYIDHVAHANGAQKLTINSPAADIEADDHQAPYCTNVTVTVHVL
jgi:phage-related baseplate assembly protein